MDTTEARFKCLEVARSLCTNLGTDAESATKMVTAAKTFADFVIGGPVKESANSGRPKGADEQ